MFYSELGINQSELNEKTQDQIREIFRAELGTVPELLNS